MATITSDINNGTFFDILGSMIQRHLAFCLCPGLPLFCLVSALEVLRHANRLGGQDVYKWSFLSEEDEGVLDSNGLWLHPSTRVEMARDADMSFIVAGFEAWDLKMPRVSKWLSGQSRNGAILGGISNGSFVLADMGFLEGYAATTHWEDFSSFCELHPSVIGRYQRFVVDRKRMSCSGGASTLDLFLEIVRDDLGSDIARKVSRQMLLEDYAGHNSGLQPRIFDGSHHYSPQVQRIFSLLDAGIDGRMTVNILAEKVGLSRRELLRLLQKETGQTPSEILNTRRLERARSLVQHSHLPLAAVAQAVGFSSQSHLTLRYREMYEVTPAQDRRQRQGSA
jgi:transcriptional regulator GlxA family with amidase domain